MRIIVADGNDNFRNVLAELQRDDGHDVVAVHLGGQLVAEAKKAAPDVIVAHVRFGDLNAPEALAPRGERRAHSDDPHVGRTRSGVADGS